MADDDVRVVYEKEALVTLLSSPEGDVAKMLVRAGAQVERRAKRLCPVDTGRLRSSITARLERDSAGLVEMVGSNVEYAPYVEFGTFERDAETGGRAIDAPTGAWIVRGAAQPYLRPALQAVAEALP